MTMRKTLLSLFAALAALTAAGQPVERIYVSTDKGAYVAGDLVWCSLFCIDAAGTPVLSSASSIAYLELVSSQGTAVTGKIALIGGRGAGVLALPANMPTGNYALVAYTSCNRNEQGRGYLDGARILSVFNTMTTERIPGGVEIIDNQITDTEENILVTLVNCVDSHWRNVVEFNNEREFSYVACIVCSFECQVCRTCAVREVNICNWK